MICSTLSVKQQQKAAIIGSSTVSWDRVFHRQTVVKYVISSYHYLSSLSSPFPSECPMSPTDYPCPLMSVRFRKPVFGEIGHTIMNLLAVSLSLTPFNTNLLSSINQANLNLVQFRIEFDILSPQLSFSHPRHAEICFM